MLTQILKQIREIKTFLKEISWIFILGIIVYGNSLWVNFIWDDTALILENPLIKNFSYLFKIFTAHLSVHGDVFYRPMQNLTYMVDFLLYKFDCRGYHLTNILLHILAVVLFYKLTLLITQKKRISLSACLLYLVCPLWVETVTYISGRADILMAIFIAASFIFFIQERIFLSLLCYSFALLSKEASLIFPLVLFCYAVIFQKNKRKLRFGIFNTSILVMLYLWLKIFTSGSLVISSGKYVFYPRLLFFIKAVGKYLSLIFFPFNQQMLYIIHLPESFLQREVFLTFLLCVFLASLFFYHLKREKFISFFILWFFLMLIPQSGIFPINAFFSEHFIYLAALGIFVVFIYFLEQVKSRIIFRFIFFSCLSFFAFSTIRYNTVWQDPVKFYQRIIELSPESFAAYNNLGIIYLDRGDFKEAERLFKRCLEIKPEFSEAKLNLSRFYYLKKDYPRAIGLAKGVLAEDPKNVLALDFLGTFFYKQQDYNLAKIYYQKAIALNPNYSPLLLDLYSLYILEDKQEEAEEIKKTLFRIDRYSLAEIYLNDSKEFLGQNDLTSALSSINQALKINPYNSHYYSFRGYLLKQQGNYIGAFFQFKRALEVSPLNWEAYNSLGSLFARVGDFQNAKRNFKQAIRLNSNFSDAHFNLGLLYFGHKKFKEARGFFQKTILLDDAHALAKEYLKLLDRK